MPYISADLSFKGGDSLASSATQGLAALAARVLTKGTAQRSATAMQDWLADRASGMSASAGRQSFSLSLSGPSRFDTDLFGMLHEVLTTPSFAPEEVEREKQSQIASIRSVEDKPLDMVFRRLPAFLFPGSVFGYYPQGQEQEIAAYTPETVRAFWDKQRLQPWVLAVAGNFDREAVVRAAKGLPAPEAAPVNVPPPAWGTDKALELHMPGRNQAHYIQLFQTVPMTHQDAPALDLLYNILTGQSGLLFLDLRDDKGLGYTVTALSGNGSKYGYLAFYIGTEPEKLAESEAGFARIIKSLQTDLLSAEAINRGKNRMEGNYYRERQTLGSRSGEAASLTLLGEPLDFQRAHIDKALNVGAEELMRIAQTYLKPGSAYTVTLLP